MGAIKVDTTGKEKINMEANEKKVYAIDKLKEGKFKGFYVVNGRYAFSSRVVDVVAHKIERVINEQMKFNSNAEKVIICSVIDLLCDALYEYRRDAFNQKEKDEQQFEITPEWILEGMYQKRIHFLIKYDQEERDKIRDAFKGICVLPEVN